MSFQGVEFTPETRKMVVNIKVFFQKMKKEHAALKQPATKLAASALGISESTVKVIMAAYNKAGDEGLDWSKFEQRGHPQYTIESGVEPVVRQFIRDANVAGRLINVDLIRHFMRD
jgi:hypothetical protein